MMASHSGPFPIPTLHSLQRSKTVVTFRFKDIWVEKEECNQQELQHPNLACAFDNGRESDGRKSNGQKSNGQKSDGQGSNGQGSDNSGSDSRGSDGRRSDDRGSNGWESNSWKNNGPGSNGLKSDGPGSNGPGNDAGKIMEIHYNQLKNCYYCAGVCDLKQTKQNLKIEQQVDGAVNQVYKVKCWDFDDT
ncbi:hypothetical protein MMC22_004633 [Lobaria immixta]|nr:hypothetical protein [Lobaria immixta]